MKYLVLLEFFTCVFIGIINAQQTNGTGYVQPLDPLLEEDIIGEALNPDDFALAETLGDEETIEYNSTNRDPLENVGVDDENLVEGDIYKYTFESDSPLRGSDQRWPNGKIPYLISASFGRKDRAVIAKAMLQFKKYTCIRFVPSVYGAAKKPRNYVHIVKGNGCSSVIGRTGKGGQRLSLGRDCVQTGIVVHECLHAVGFWHEQSRPDRDNYIWIYWKNIVKGVESNFKKSKKFARTLLRMPYDLGSVMHYGKYSFSKKPGKKPTIVAKNGAHIGQRKGLSEMDIKKINKWYKCKGVKPKPKPEPKPGKKCADKKKSCKRWAEDGECKNYASYMEINCRKSCHYCKGYSTCSNENENCRAWAIAGQCLSKKYRKYMKAKCSLACGYCA